MRDQKDFKHGSKETQNDEQASGSFFAAQSGERSDARNTVASDSCVHPPAPVTQDGDASLTVGAGAAIGVGEDSQMVTLLPGVFPSEQDLAEMQVGCF